MNDVINDLVNIIDLLQLHWLINMNVAWTNFYIYQYATLREITLLNFAL